jgi:orotate phosphoribosyltransferase
MSAQEKQRLLEIIKKDGYFREKIVLSSGKESDYYIDARRVTLGAEGAYLCGKLILEAVKKEKYDAIGGPTLGADPMVGAIGVLSFLSGNPVNTFIIRKAPKAHGKQQQVEGPLLKEGASVILIDDVATTGKAFLESIDVFEKMNIKTPVAVCIVDRKEGASQALAARGCELLSIFDIKEIHK